ncbi:MAG TPA: hypothetical protein P5110_02705 [Candidatus Omnitrophota bacterium]|nr:hypothetical protein [Candidatus Omnitrophota bacterium]HRZ14398.1 hypothetical protein [Candidatus Omnitrophota bacterium]
MRNKLFDMLASKKIFIVACGFLLLPALYTFDLLLFNAILNSFLSFLVRPAGVIMFAIVAAEIAGIVVVCIKFPLIWLGLGIFLIGIPLALVGSCLLAPIAAGVFGLFGR